MHRKRTLALLSLLLLIVIACVLLRTTTPASTETFAIEEASSTPLTLSEETPADPIDTPEDTPITIEPVIPQPPVVISPAPESPKGCYVGGCSSQICSDRPDMASTCEWRESYACYRTASCERQPSGECGWTGTPTLQACLVEADANTTVAY